MVLVVVYEFVFVKMMFKKVRCEIGSNDLICWVVRVISYDLNGCIDKMFKFILGNYYFFSFILGNFGFIVEFLFFEEDNVKFKWF